MQSQAFLIKKNTYTHSTLHYDMLANDSSNSVMEYAVSEARIAIFL